MENLSFSGTRVTHHSLADKMTHFAANNPTFTDTVKPKHQTAPQAGDYFMKAENGPLDALN